MEIDLYPAAALWTGSAWWSGDEVADVLAAWRRWQATAPEEITTTLRVLRLPPDPDLPPALTGDVVIGVEGAAIASTRRDLDAAEAAVTGMLRALRGAGEPVIDSWYPADSLAVTRSHLAAPGPPQRGGDHALAAGLDDRFDEALLTAAGIPGGRPEPDGPLVAVELHQLGGAIGRPGTGADRNIDHLPGEVAYRAVARTGDARDAAALDRARTALAPWLLDTVAPSFVTTPGSPARWLGTEQLDRLDRVAARVDPDGVMAAARTGLAPAWAGDPG